MDKLDTTEELKQALDVFRDAITWWHSDDRRTFVREPYWLEKARVVLKDGSTKLKNAGHQRWDV